jgi:hypothetical protein
VVVSGLTNERASQHIRLDAPEMLRPAMFFSIFIE